MTRMKESGIDWIGQIPEEWELGRVKDFYKFFTGFTPDTSRIEYYGDINDYVWVTIADMTSKKIESSKQTISDIFVKEKRPQVSRLGSLLYSFKLSVGKVAFANTDLYTNEAIATFEDGPNINLRFLYYSSYLIEFNSETNIYGAKLLNSDRIRNAYIVQPLLSEQTKIADFLDKKTTQLDKVKSLLEEQIQKLKDYRASLIYETVTKGLDKTVPMKDSGIDWIGQVPQGWGVSKLEQYVDIFGRIGFRGYTTNDIVNEGEGAISYSPSNIIDYSVIDNNNTYISWSKYDESPEIQIKTGDVLYVKTGSSYGKAGIVNKLSNKATINPQLVVLKPKKNTDSRLINYFLNSSVGKDQSELIVGGSTIPTITQESIKKMIFPKMSFEEQQKIADFLDKKTIQIDKLIQIKNQQIENINKQRQTLIYDYVTGKRRA